MHMIGGKSQNEADTVSLIIFSPNDSIQVHFKLQRTSVHA